MGWDRVAVVGAGMIKFGELFEQSYEQMAQGSLQGRSRKRRQGFRPSRHRRRHRGYPAREPLGPGGCWRQHRRERHRARRSAVHPGGECVPVRFRRCPASARWWSPRGVHPTVLGDRRREDARQVDRRRVSSRVRLPGTRLQPRRNRSRPLRAVRRPATCTSSARPPRCSPRWP